ncbi:MAG: hypothetical protein M3O15_02745, partial [Acidobacteriota bacterium]|nr:hypothetical protein [Acidobacteriota bacterium]
PSLLWFFHSVPLLVLNVVAFEATWFLLFRSVSLEGRLRAIKPQTLPFLLLAASAPLLLVLMLTQPSHLSFVRLEYATFGTLFLFLWHWMECRPSESHHLVLGLLLLALALPGPSSAFLAPPLADMGIAQILAGSSIILAGLLDHRQLVGTLGGPLPALELETEAQAELRS